MNCEDKEEFLKQAKRSQNQSEALTWMEFQNNINSEKFKVFFCIKFQ